MSSGHEKSGIVWLNTGGVEYIVKLNHSEELSDSLAESFLFPAKSSATDFQNIVFDLFVKLECMIPEKVSFIKLNPEERLSSW